MAVSTRDVPLRDARAGIESRLRDTFAGWGDSELSQAPGPDDEAALQNFLRTFEGALSSCPCRMRGSKGVNISRFLPDAVEHGHARSNAYGFLWLVRGA